MQNLVLSVNGVDKTYTQVTPYGGKAQPAVWLLRDDVTPLGNRRIEIGMYRNGNGTRKVTYKVTVPYTVTVEGVPTKIGQCLFDSSNGYVLPDVVPVSVVTELQGTVSALAASVVMQDFVVDELPAY